MIHIRTQSLKQRLAAGAGVARRVGNPDTDSESVGNGEYQNMKSL